MNIKKHEWIFELSTKQLVTFKLFVKATTRRNYFYFCDVPSRCYYYYLSFSNFTKFISLSDSPELQDKMFFQTRVCLV